jgi:hypothetical protein
MVACESLLLIGSALVWFAIDNPARPVARAIVVGMALAMTYWTKATGLFLLFGFLLWSLGEQLLRRWVWLTVVGFVAVALPLLVRNVRVYGDPLYSYNTRFLFADSFEQGAAGEFSGTWPAAREYFRTHSVSQVLGRMWSGLGWEGYILLRSLGPASFGSGRALAGLAVLLLAGLGGLAAGSRGLLVVVWCGLFGAFFAWYVPIASGDRFWVPVLPSLLVCAAHGTVRLLGGERLPDGRTVGGRLLVAAVLWCGTVAVLSFSRNIPDLMLAFRPACGPL